MVCVAVKNRKWISARNRSPSEEKERGVRYGRSTCSLHVHATDRISTYIVTFDHPRLETTDSYTEVAITVS